MPKPSPKSKPPRGNKKPTIRDVAKAAGVSPAAVTSAFNNGPFVSEATRQRILTVAQGMSYRASFHAQKLRTGLKNTVGFVGNFHTGREYPMALFAALENAFRARGYQGLTFTGKNPEEITSLVLRGLEEDRVDGMVFCLSGMDDKVLRVMRDWNVPVLEIQPFDYLRRARPAARILTDDAGGAELAVSHLIAKGRTDLFAVGGPTDDDYTLARFDGFRRALTKAGIKVSESRILGFSNNDSCEEFLARASKTLMEGRNSRRGVFCLADEQAIQLLSHFLRAGLRLPQDIAVASYDDLQVSSLVFPALTTVRQPVADIADKAAELMVEAVKSKSALEARDYSFSCTLVERESVG